MKATFAAGAGLLLGSMAGLAEAAELCRQSGPQSPRDITDKSGANRQKFPLAGPAGELNLCNLHFHAQAEHKGPGFALAAGPGAHGGFQCN